VTEKKYLIEKIRQHIRQMSATIATGKV